MDDSNINMFEVGNKAQNANNGKALRRQQIKGRQLQIFQGDNKKEIMTTVIFKCSQEATTQRTPDAANILRRQQTNDDSSIPGIAVAANIQGMTITTKFSGSRQQKRTTLTYVLMRQRSNGQRQRQMFEKAIQQPRANCNSNKTSDDRNIKVLSRQQIGRRVLRRQRNKGQQYRDKGLRRQQNIQGPTATAKFYQEIQK